MKSILPVLMCLLCFNLTWGQEVKIKGNKFTLDNKEIWFNGINTPWHLFGDFGRQDFNAQWWTNEFAKYKRNKINLARVWVHMSGEFSPNINANGHVTGTNNIFWNQMDHLMDISEQNGVYIIPALFSFDITKDGYRTTERWRKWLKSKANVQSYIDNVLIPMVKRYKNRKYLLAWEICNEPEWMFENSEHGPQSFNDVQRMHAMIAAAIHENCRKYVTTGSAAPKWNSPIYDSWGANEGNMFSDEALSSSINNSKAFLDFYQYHWYPWQSEWMKSPFTMTTVQYGVDDKPVIVGEAEGKDVCDSYVCQTLTQMYESAYSNGFDGMCAWKTPQNDGHGTFRNIAVATNAFYNNHPNLVYPDGSDPVAARGITLSEPTLTIEEGKVATLTAQIIPANTSDKRITWTTEKEEIATVVNGSVRGVKEGEAKITATTNDGGFSDECVVTVKKREIICNNPITISLKHEEDGVGEFCWQTEEEIDHINSWNVDILEINGVNITNKFTREIPAKIEGKYNIYYKASIKWAHAEINGKPNKAFISTSASNFGDYAQLNIYPNPSSKNVTIECPNHVKSIAVYSASGEKLIEKQNTQNEAIKLSTENYLPGLYLVKVVNSNGSMSTKKLLIK